MWKYDQSAIKSFTNEPFCFTKIDTKEKWIVYNNFYNFVAIYNFLAI